MKLQVQVKLHSRHHPVGDQLGIYGEFLGKNNNIPCISKLNVLSQMSLICIGVACIADMMIDSMESGRE
jgi:hypothetical protein